MDTYFLIKIYFGLVGVVILVLFGILWREKVRPSRTSCSRVLVLLTRNGEGCMEGILRGLRRLRERGYNFETVIVDCNSQDQTPLILGKFYTKHPFFTWIKIKEDFSLKFIFPFCRGKLLWVLSLDERTDVRQVVEKAGSFFSKG
ncbi:hypothetical protein [Calderihabitans maritimus]|uniref:Glycosyltransferase n=1 Tax=Calderihabitans maritimus TaxID=1246530 RepID=A0A1Z5HUD4_9FIRM|nr:hypothetical protein [Calderihabitans maritimus]GAW93146.1 hypothetical protein KKC1_22870 [Calderihabitans maritimus]